jgi:predicted transcriptional regulator
MKININVECCGKNVSAYVDEIPGFIIAAKNVRELQEDIREALDFHADGCEKDGISDEWLINRHSWEFVYHYDIGSLLSLYDGILNQNSLGRITGINPSLVRQYLCGVKNPSKKRLADIQEKLHTFAVDLANISIS